MRYSKSKIKLESIFMREESRRTLALKEIFHEVRAQGQCDVC